MLPRAARLHSARDFSAVMRSGRRAGTSRLVVHVLAGASQGSSRAGFVVSRQVGNSVVRHRVTRRLRPLVSSRLAGLPAGTDVVVRALPSAATATSVELDRDLATGWRVAVRKAGLS